MTDQLREDDPRPQDQAPEQSWGQGEGKHEPTIPDDAEKTPSTYAGGTPTSVDDADAGLSREDEGMDR